MNESQFVIKRLRRSEDAQHAFCCMAEVPTPWPEALELCRGWVGQNLERYVEGYHLHAPDGAVVGQLYYAPSERALIPYELEPGLAVMYCEWIQRSYQGQGLGRRLFAAFEADMREDGCKGILVEATDQEELLHYRHYVVRGFQVIHEANHRKLLYLPLHQAIVHARPLASTIRPQQGLPLEILILNGYMCPFEVSSQVILLEVAREFGDQVIVRQEWLTPSTLRTYGVASGVFINGRQKFIGATTEEAIRQAIAEELSRV